MPALQEQLKKLLAEPLKDEDLQEEPLKTVLQNVQGNILHGHGRDFAVHIFLQFKDGQQANVKKWLRDNIICKNLSAQDQRGERQKYPKSKDRHALFVSCLLSAKGYEFLGATTVPFMEEFRSGMTQAAARLQDPPSISWEDRYQQEIHALILLAHHNKNTLQEAQQTLVDNHIRPFTVHSWMEYGHVLYKEEDGAREEHFGYADGLSQPLFFQCDLDTEAQTRGIDQWNPGVGPHLVLTRDPLGEEMVDYGSYVVFRKLEQDVARFAEQIRSFAQAEGVDEQIVRARVVGRFRDGTPLVLSDAPSVPTDAKTVGPNNFRYDTDWQGQRGPFNAHIRRMNPRWAPGSLAYDRRIARRGIPYGARGDKSVGLLFMCYQQNLKTQFEALQGEWAQTPAAFPHTGPDSLIGRVPTGEQSTAPKRWAILGQVTAPSMSDCVTLKGGEYFFAPSIRVLKDILTRL
jgi:Dyp-type peroxidase family